MSCGHDLGQALNLITVESMVVTNTRPIIIECIL